MKYGKTAHGERWHALRPDGVPACVAYQERGQQFIVNESMKIAIVSDGLEVPRDNICLNCHEALGRKGRKLRQAIESREKTARKTRRDVYEPKHRFEDES